MKNLVKILEKKKISKLKLAMGSGVTPSDLYSAMAGKKPFYPAWKKKISEYLKIDEKELFGEKKKEGEKS